MVHHLKKVGLLIIMSVCIYISMNDIKEESISLMDYQKEKIGMQKREEKLELEIPDLDFKRLIKIGTIDKIDDSFATLLEQNTKNKIIAGHDIDLVFHELHNVKIGMTILFNEYGKKQEYQVEQILIVHPYEAHYLEETEEEQLTLITCTEYDQKRLVITCKRI